MFDYEQSNRQPRYRSCCSIGALSLVELSRLERFFCKVGVHTLDFGFAKIEQEAAGRNKARFSYLSLYLE